MVRGSVESLDLAGIFSTYPNPHINFVQAFAVEMVITAILMGVIMALGDDGNGIPRGPLAPLLIGLLIAVIGASMGPLTGFAMNPARDTGPKPSPSLRDGAMSPSRAAKTFLTSRSAVRANCRGGAGRIRLSQINWSPLTVRHLCGRGKETTSTTQQKLRCNLTTGHIP